MQVDQCYMICTMSVGRTHTGPSPFESKTVSGGPVALIQAQQIKNDLPACVTISSKALCADVPAFNHPFLYLQLRIHVCKCWYCYDDMTISVIFSLSPVQDPCLQVLIPLSLSDNINFLQATSQSKEIWSQSCRPISVMHNVSRSHSYWPIAIWQQESLNTAGKLKLTYW